MIDQQKEEQDQIIDNAVIFNGDNETLEHPEEPSAQNLAGVAGRLTREKNKESGDIDEVWNITLKTFCFPTFYPFIILFNSMKMSVLIVLRWWMTCKRR